MIFFCNIFSLKLFLLLLGKWHNPYFCLLIEKTYRLLLCFLCGEYKINNHSHSFCIFLTHQIEWRGIETENLNPSHNGVIFKHCEDTHWKVRGIDNDHSLEYMRVFECSDWAHKICKIKISVIDMGKVWLSYFKLYKKLSDIFIYFMWQKLYCNIFNVLVL